MGGNLLAIVVCFREEETGCGRVAIVASSGQNSEIQIDMVFAV